MSADKRKNQNAKSSPAKVAPRPASTPPRAATAPPPRVPPLFRPVDWLVMGITALILFIAYFHTLAPDVTLEDSGELATASFYAGIPHAPGYPIWSIYTWFWTLIPFGSVAWRVGLSSAFAAAMASGMLAFLVSRSSSMLIESIEELKNIGRRWENAICFVSGFVAGGLIGFNGFMWSQAVIVEVYPLSVASLMGVVICLLRWVYAPHQHRYLYGAFFLYGICFNNHQSLLPIVMGMQVLTWMAEPKLGREFFFGNTIIYAIVGFIIKPPLLNNNTSVFVIYNIIGIASALLWIWLLIKTKKTAIEFFRDVAMLALLGCLGLLFLGYTDYLPGFNNGPKLFLIFIAAVVACGFFIHLFRKTKKLSKEWFTVLVCGVSWLVGAAFYLYEPIACMTDPPMQWAYPRTVQGFIHAITRGQYSPINPTSGHGGNVFQIIVSFFATYGLQLWRYLEAMSEEFNLFLLLLALLVFLFYRKFKRRERVWLIGMAATYMVIGPFLVLLLNFSPTRQSIDIAKVLFTAGYVFICMFVGYGVTLACSYIVTQYETARKWLLVGGLCGLDFALFTVAANCQALIGTIGDETVSRYGFLKVACWILAIATVLILRKNGMQNDRLLYFGLPGLFVLLSVFLTLATVLQDQLSLSALTGFFHNLAQAFSPHQYGLPIYAGLILLGIAVVFFGSVWIRRQKGPIGIALVVFAIIPSYSTLTHWADNEQHHHWFGYWFGHDMFTPPFGIYPKMAHNAILFGGTDPGRFVPTYMIFCESFIPDTDKPKFDPTFNRRDVYLITQNALADSTYLQYLRAQYFPSHEHDGPFFQEVLRGPEERKQDYTTNLLARIADTLLDKPLMARGNRIEARWRREGVYPKKEIYIPSDEDLQNSFAEYSQDVQRRARLGELEPGETATPVTNANGQVQVQVSGQVAVMKINGILCKVIFDHNPTNQFYVEESFPLDWMFPHETPFGIIMKINRQVVPTYSPEVFRKDHEFWSKYSARLIGNWITYKTSVKQIAAFAEKVYLHRNFSGFKGDLKFVRDDDAQKAFSKLRSSIAGLYAWRLGALQAVPTPPQYLAKTSKERQELIKEADFAFKQAFAFCPYSPEVVYRYVTLLVDLNRMDDAITVAKTCSDFDPYNSQVANLVKQLEAMKKQSASRAKFDAQLQQMQNEARTNPTNFQNIFELASIYYQRRQTGRVTELLDNALANPHITPNDIGIIAQFYAHIGNLPEVAKSLKRLAAAAPNEPEPPYDLAALDIVLGKTNECFQNLRKALELNAKRLKQNPKASNLLDVVRKDRRFDAVRHLPEFQKLVPPD